MYDVQCLRFLDAISDFVGFFGGEKYASFFENWEISNNELNVLKLEFEVNIMDNKTSHNSSSI